MSDIKMYDILGQFNGLNTKSVPASASQTDPLYETVEPLDSVTESVTAMEAKYATFKESVVAEKTKVRSDTPAEKFNPENIDSADATIQNLLTKARFSRPGAKSDLEAIVYHIAKQDEELERAKTAEEEDRQLIKKAQAVTDQMNNRFKKLNAKVAAGQITAQDRAQAQAAQQIEKDADAAKAAVTADPNAPVQQIAEPTDQQPTATSTPVQTTATPAKATQQKPAGISLPNKKGDLEDQPKAGTVDVPPGLAIATAPDVEPAYGEPDNEPDFFGVNKIKAAENKINEGYYKNIDVANQEAAEKFVDTNKKQVAQFATNPNLQSVKLSYPNGMINMTRSTYDKVAKGLAKIGDKILKNRVETDIFSNRDLLAKYMMDIESAPGVDYYYFYNVKQGQEAKAFSIGLKQSKNGNWYYPRAPLPAAEKLFGQSIKWSPGQPAGTNATTNEQINSGKNTMTKPNSIIEAVRSVEDKKLKEAAKPDFLDLDKDGDTDEPMKQAAKDAKKHEPADVDKDAVAKRKRLQALKDKQEDERAEKGDDYKSATRFVKGRAYGGSAQKDDEDKDEVDEGMVDAIGSRIGHAVKGAKRALAGKPSATQVQQQHAIKARAGQVNLGATAQQRADAPGEEKKAERTDKVLRNVSAQQAGYKNDVDEGNLADKVTGDLQKIAAKKDYKSKKDFTSADWDKVAKPHGFTGKEVAAVRGHKFKEGTNFGDTIKNSKGKMTKVTVKEGKDAIRNHPIYTTKEAWDHYSQELAEQEAMDEAVMAPAVNVQQELDEIAKLAGLPTRACEACNCAPCKCDEGLEAMAPSDSSSPLTHTELDEAATRKDFRMVANLIKNNPDREKAKELAHHHADIFKQQNPRFKREMFLSACGLEECGAMPTAVIVGEDKCPTCDCAPCKCDEGMMEAEMEEGNEFSGALAAAKASGAKDFEVGGKKYTVKEDININVTANGEEDVVNLIRKLSGMEAIKTVTDKISAMSGEACGACGSSPCGCEAVAETVEDGPKERDLEYTNSPREEQAGSDAAFPGGTDLNRPKKSYSDKPYRGDNPMAVAEAKEEALWKSYETMINDVKA